MSKYFHQQHLIEKIVSATWRQSKLLLDPSVIRKPLSKEIFLWNKTSMHISWIGWAEILVDLSKSTMLSFEHLVRNIEYWIGLVLAHCCYMGWSKLWFCLCIFALTSCKIIHRCNIIIIFSVLSRDQNISCLGGGA